MVFFLYLKIFHIAAEVKHPLGAFGVEGEGVSHGHVESDAGCAVKNHTHFLHHFFGESLVLESETVLGNVASHNLQFGENAGVFGTYLVKNLQIIVILTMDSLAKDEQMNKW